MKLHLAILLLLACLAVASPIRSKRDEEAGSTEELKGALETVDIDSLLKNQRYIETQIKCVRHSGKCDKTGKQIKVLLPEVLQRSCASCGEKQKYNINRVVEHVKANYPSDWTAIDEEYSKA